MTRIRAAVSPKPGMRVLRDEVLGRFLAKSRPNWIGAGQNMAAENGVEWDGMWFEV